MFQLPKLDYGYDALKPHIDQQTMEIHHQKHHQGYIDKLNAAIENTQYQDWSIEDLMQKFDQLPQNIQTSVRNNGGGHYNHSLFWKSLTPQSNSPEGLLAEKIQQSFGGQDQFQEQFSQAAASRFGSGWAWLVFNDQNELKVLSTPNQDNPLMQGKIPLLGLDVWEHAYYLNYQNRRADYIEAFWSIVNWDEVSRRYEKVLAG